MFFLVKYQRINSDTHGNSDLYQEISATENHTRTYMYDALARIDTVLNQIDSDQFDTTHHYDGSYGRLKGSSSENTQTSMLRRVGKA